jgi:hypothetical protein
MDPVVQKVGRLVSVAQLQIDLWMPRPPPT